MRTSHGGFKIKRHQPWRLWFGILAMAGLLFVSFILGQEYRSYELQRLQVKHDALLHQVSDIEIRNYDLVQKNAQLERISKIERDAYQLANRTLIKHQEEISALKEDLAFYRGIVSPTNAASAVNLQSFEIERRSRQGLHYFKLVLTKNGKRNTNIKGRLRVVVRGELDGAIREYRLEEIKVDQKNQFDRFNFRYFQIFEGNVVIPTDFHPYEIEIHVNPSTKQVKSLTETISWITAISEGL